MDLYSLAEYFGKVLNLFGVVVIVVGVFAVSFNYANEWLVEKKPIHEFYKKFRVNLGRIILLGLEILVAGDIIRTVVGDPSIIGIVSLAIIVLVRTFLSFAFETEVEGKFPWKKQ